MFDEFLGLFGGMIAVPFWFMLFLIFGFFVCLAGLLLFLIWARGPAMGFIKSRAGGKIPVIHRHSTGMVSIKLAKTFPEYLETKKYNPFFLPAFKQPEKGKPDYWDSIKKPVYIADERKAMALTVDDIAVLSDVLDEEKDTASEKEKNFLSRLIQRLVEKKKIDVTLGGSLPLAAIQRHIDDRWNISAVRAYGREYEERGRKSAGFNMATFSTLIGIAVLFMVLAIIAQWSGLFG